MLTSLRGAGMRLAVLAGAHTFEIHEAPIPEIEPDQVLVRVAACGVCTSELDMWDGSGDATYPVSPGHEVSGTVVEVGDQVAGFSVGDPVATWVTTKGFADYVAVHADYCRAAGQVPLDLALGEPLACAVNAVELADVRLGDDVVIIGAGFMGNLVQMLVDMRGTHQVIVADTRPDALERAKALGATRVVDVRTERLADVVAERTESGADLTFECTGAQAPLLAVGDVTRMSGKIALVGYHQGAPREIPLGLWNWKAFTLLNAHFREVATILRGMTIGMRLLTSGALSLEPLVTHRFPLAEIDDAFRLAREKPDGFVKATIVMDARNPPGAA
jgi:2-desacetyl-2-hydroxyethyl bacteriochlorophyllide A dehydrogenase